MARAILDDQPILGPYFLPGRGLDPGLADPSIEPQLNQMLIPLLSVVEKARARDALRDVAHRHHEAKRAHASRPT